MKQNQTMNDDLLYLIALKKIPLIGDITAKKLIAHFGSAKNIFAQRRSSLEKVMGIGSKITQNILNSQYLQEATLLPKRTHKPAKQTTAEHCRYPQYHDLRHGILRTTDRRSRPT